MGGNKMDQQTRTAVRRAEGDVSAQLAAARSCIRYGGSLADVAQALRITASARRRDSNPHIDDQSWQADHWTVTIRCSRRSMSVPYSKGIGHGGRPPQVGEVLSSLLMDSSAVDADFPEWAADFGYDTDSIRARQTRQVCRRLAQRLQRVLGPERFDLLRGASWDD